MGCGVSGLGRMLCWAGVLGVRGAARRCGCLVRLLSAVWWLGWVRCVRAWDGRAAGELSLRAGQPASHGVWSGAAVCLGACWDCLCGIEGCLAGVRASELRRKGARWSGCPGGSGVCAEAALSGARRVGCLFCDRQAMRGVLGGGQSGVCGCGVQARCLWTPRRVVGRTVNCLVVSWTLNRVPGMTPKCLVSWTLSSLRLEQDGNLLQALVRPGLPFEKA